MLVWTAAQFETSGDTWERGTVGELLPPRFSHAQNLANHWGAGPIESSGTSTRGGGALGATRRLLMSRLTFSAPASRSGAGVAPSDPRLATVGRGGGYFHASVVSDSGMVCNSSRALCQPTCLHSGPNAVTLGGRKLSSGTQVHGLHAWPCLATSKYNDIPERSCTPWLAKYNK